MHSLLPLPTFPFFPRLHPPSLSSCCPKLFPLLLCFSRVVSVLFNSRDVRCAPFTPLLLVSSPWMHLLRLPPAVRLLRLSSSILLLVTFADNCQKSTPGEDCLKPRDPRRVAPLERTSSLTRVRSADSHLALIRCCFRR